MFCILKNIAKTLKSMSFSLQKHCIAKKKVHCFTQGLRLLGTPCRAMTKVCFFSQKYNPVTLYIRAGFFAVLTPFWPFWGVPKIALRVLESKFRDKLAPKTSKKTP